MTADIVFWGSLWMLGYVYIGYPATLAWLSRIIPKRIRKHACEPSVSIVIAAHNEIGSIEATIANKLALDYPKEKLEIVVVSDGSNDGTDAVVQEFAERFPGRVRLVRQEPRLGKTAALNRVVPDLQSEIVIFSDANSLYERNAVRALVPNFADPQVGYVTGRMTYSNTDDCANSRGCSKYSQYENGLRCHETRIGSVVGVDGGIDAVRRSLYVPMRQDQLPDLVLPLNVIVQGYRVVYEPEAQVTEPALAVSGDEYRMRVRVALRAFWALWELREVANPLRYGLYAWQVLSHKVLRYLAFVFLLTLALSNAVLFDSNWFYTMSGIAQGLFYAGGLLATFASGTVPKLFNVPYYFMVVNAAAAHAFWKFLNRERMTVWQPRLG